METVRAARGTQRSTLGWPQEAALRMLQNNLDPEVAERPADLVVYGGTGKAARSWDAFHQIVRALRSQRRYARSGTGQTSPTRATASSSRRTTVTVVERDKKREARPGDPRARARQKAPTGALCLRFSVQAGRGVPTPGLSAPSSKP